MTTLLKPTDKWITIKDLSLPISISEEVKVIHCDTRDFHIICSDKKPTVYEKTTCNLEEWHNKGLTRLYKICKGDKRLDYTISNSEIILFLLKLCNETGGFDKDWRLICADIDNGRNWELKYLRFVRNEHYPNEFIVCNSYMMPVKYKNIIPNLLKEG